MTNIKTKLSAAVAMAALMGSAIAPMAFADTTIVVKDNGTKSETNVSVDNSDYTKIEQDNKTLIVNNVDVDSNTGKNDANNNTGKGGVGIKTGDITTKTDIENTGSSNYAEGTGCGCEEDTKIIVKDNGKKSKVNVDVNNGDTLKVDQDNKTKIINKVDVDSNTGKNDANGNTGKGKKWIKTGDIKTKTNIKNTGSSNILIY